MITTPKWIHKAPNETENGQRTQSEMEDRKMDDAKTKEAYQESTKKRKAETESYSQTKRTITTAATCSYD